MRLDSRLILQFAFLTCCSAGIVSAQTLFQAEGRDTIKVFRKADTNSTVTEQQHVEFHHLSLWDIASKTSRELIAKETLTTSQDQQLEGTRSKVKVDLYFVKANGTFPTEPSNSIEIPNVHNVTFRDDHWVATTIGCCDSEPYGRLYTYGGDSPFLRFNTSYAKVEIPNTPVIRYVGEVLRSEVANDAAEEVIFGRNKKAVAAIFYAAPGKSLQQLLLEQKPGAEKSYTLDHTAGVVLSSSSPRDETSNPGEETGPINLQLYSLDPSQDGQKSLPVPHAISGLIIKASFDATHRITDDKMYPTTETVTIHVNNDRFGAIGISGDVLKPINQ